MIRDCKICAPGTDVFSAADILVFCLYAVINSTDQIRSLYGGASIEVAIRFQVPWALCIVIRVGFWSSNDWPLLLILVLIDLTKLIDFLFHQSVFGVVRF